jgi:hypothetical protein
VRIEPVKYSRRPRSTAHPSAAGGAQGRRGRGRAGGNELMIGDSKMLWRALI